MAEKSFLARIFGFKEQESEKVDNNRSDDFVNENVQEQDTSPTLQDAINFTYELQSYYYNDICKMQSDLLLKTSLAQTRINFINKKIKQEQVILSQIDNLIKIIKQYEKEYQEIWKKSIYSFYDEIEKTKLSGVQKKVFEILLKLYEINTKEELKSVIKGRLEKYKIAWNIGGNIKLPININAILVDEANGIEKYNFGEFSKYVYASDSDKVLTSKQLDKIKKLNVTFEKEIFTNSLWVYVSSCERYKLNFMRRTCILGNDWEYIPETEKGLFFDVIRTKDLEQYLKGILQIVLAKRTYAVISIVVPTEEMLGTIGEIKRQEGRTKICKRYRFILKERDGIYKENLLTARIDRRHIPEELRFISYLKFKSDYF